MSNNTNPGVSKAVLEKLIANYQSKVKRVRKSGDHTPHDHDPKIDSKSAWFPRAAIEELLNLNDADGLRIYFGVHDTAIMATPYDDKLTVVLVATKNIGGRDQDQLFEKTETESLSMKSRPTTLAPGTGLNHSLICPPDRCP